MIMLMLDLQDFPMKGGQRDWTTFLQVHVTSPPSFS